MRKTWERSRFGGKQRVLFGKVKSECAFIKRLREKLNSELELRGTVS